MEGEAVSMTIKDTRYFRAKWVVEVLHSLLLSLRVGYWGKLLFCLWKTHEQFRCTTSFIHRKLDNLLYVYGSVHHNIFYEITNRCSYMQSNLFHC